MTKDVLSLLIRSATEGSVCHVRRKAELTGDVFPAKIKHGCFFLKP